MPDLQKISEYKFLNLLGRLHLDPDLWHFHRNCIAKAFAVGLFTAFMPIPFQMLMAAILAILFRANLPVSVALVWITNPITMPPIFYFAYKIGTHIVTIAPEPFITDTTWEWITMEFGKFWKPTLFGLFACAITSAIIGYFGIKIIWRICVTLRWQARKKEKTIKNQVTLTPTQSHTNYFYSIP